MSTRSSLFASALVTLATVAPSARAQVPTVDPSGEAPAEEPVEAEAADSGYSGGGTAEAPASAPGGTAPEDDGSYYYTDDLDVQRPSREGLSSSAGPVPETHVVRSGDTLWDICGFYFNNPWEWPRVWSYNPTITNPHWIYPGDLVRLYAAGAAPIAAAPTSTEAEPVGVSADAPVPRRGFSLKNLAFVDAKDLDDAIIIDGAVEEKLMLTRGESVYLRYVDKNKPKPGDRFSVYEEVEKVTHPKTGKAIGSFVRIRGDLEVKSIKKDKRARADITRSNDTIERGQRVGPIKKVFDEVEPRRNEKSLQGYIVGKIGGGELIGAREVVIVDLGKQSGIQTGNRLFVVRRGDAYPERTNPKQQIGVNDERFPARAVGEVIIVDVGEHISLALVTLSIKELGIGDMLLMRPDSE